MTRLEPVRIDPARTGTLGPRVHYFRQLDLAPHLNNMAAPLQRGIGSADEPAAAGGMAGFVPAEEATLSVDGIPYTVPPTRPGLPDNVCCIGQIIPLPPGSYDWIHLLTAADGPVEDFLALHYTDGHVRLEALEVADFWAAPSGLVEPRGSSWQTARGGLEEAAPEREACIWCHRVPVTRQFTLGGLGLPTNLEVHVFAITLRFNDDIA